MILRDTDPLWLAFAALDIGKTEKNNDAPWLRAMLASMGLGWLIGQPWCGSMLARWMRNAGLEPPRHAYRALSWLDWGKTIDEPVRGCIVVFERKGGGHVAIVVGRQRDGQLVCLGGNQMDSVSLAAFPAGRVLGYRLPAIDRRYDPLPTMEAASSRSEA